MSAKCQQQTLAPQRVCSSESIVQSGSDQLEIYRAPEALPDVPAVAEFVPGYEASGWVPVFRAKSSTPNIEFLEPVAAFRDPREQFGSEPLTIR